MFGLSIKEMLYKVIVNACYNCKKIYKDSILERLDELSSSDDESLERINMEIRQKYLNAVKNSVVEHFRLSTPAIYARINLALLSPALCGYEDINPENGMMAGSVYAICYYGINDRVAPAKLCIKLNHIQNDIMDEVLQEIADEIQP